MTLTTIRFLEDRWVGIVGNFDDYVYFPVLIRIIDDFIILVLFALLPVLLAYSEYPHNPVFIFSLLSTIISLFMRPFIREVIPKLLIKKKILPGNTIVTNNKKYLITEDSKIIMKSIRGNTQALLEVTNVVPIIDGLEKIPSFL